MNRKLIGTLFLLLVVGFWLWWHSGQPTGEAAPQPSASEANQTNQSSFPIQKQRTTAPAAAAAISKPTPESNPADWIEKRRKQMDDARQEGLNEWRTPIEFYGKVVDENTNPVANADVRFVWTDLSPKGNSESQSTSDESGLFSLRDVTGKALTVEVSKRGYYAYKSFPVGFFYAGENQNFVPDIANPVIFRLKKKGVAERLIHIAGKFSVPRNGTPVEIDLSTGKQVPTGQGQLRVECWTDDQGKTPGQKYDWKCRITVPGGGLLPSAIQFDFQAPLEGYAPFDEIDMPASLNEDWSRFGKRDYFLKLNSGAYARISFQMIAFNDHFFKLDSYLNPSGSPNLEFDPDNVVQAGN